MFGMHTDLFYIIGPPYLVGSFYRKTLRTLAFHFTTRRLVRKWILWPHIFYFVNFLLLAGSQNRPSGQDARPTLPQLIRCSVFDVGCSMFSDLRLGTQDSRCAQVEMEYPKVLWFGGKNIGPALRCAGNQSEYDSSSYRRGPRIVSHAGRHQPRPDHIHR